MRPDDRHSAQLSVSQNPSFIGAANLDTIENHLVFRNPVPVKFALQRMESQVTVSIFGELEKF